MDKEQTTSKKFQVAVGVIVVVVLIAVYYFFAVKNKTKPDNGSDTVEKFSSSLDAVTAPGTVNVPSTNPAKQAVPPVNPLEKTNPFKNAYTNPFE